MMRIAITGITGFIGRPLALRLLRQGHAVRGLVRSREKAALLPDGIEKVYGTVHDRDALLKTFASCDLVYHCAAVVGGGEKTMMDVNVRGTGDVCAAAAGIGIKKMIYLSSIAVVSGNNGPYPLKEDLPYRAYNGYGISKIEAEKIVLWYRNKGLNVSVIRPSAVYGPGGLQALSGVFRLAEAGFLPLAGSGLTQWQLIHVNDLTDFLTSIMDNERAYNDIFNVSSGEAIEMINLYRLVRKITGKGRIVRLPRWLLLPAAAVLDAPFLLSGKRPFADKVKFFARHHTYDTAKARELLGLKTSISLEQGLAHAYADWKNKRAGNNQNEQ